MGNLVTFVGFKSSGKNTAAQILVDRFGYSPISFADAIKDSLAVIFCWPRDLLEGITDDSRLWREQVDPWWADRLGIPEFSPRWAMKNFGTEIMRVHFHTNIWMLNVERRISMMGNCPIVLVDARFPNEIAMARRYGSLVARIKRGADPAWMELAERANSGDLTAIGAMEAYDVHLSERAWIGCAVDRTFNNDTTITNLQADVVTWLALKTSDGVSQ